MTGARSRNKGARGELAVLKQFTAAGWDGTRGFASGGQGGADLAGDMPDAVEVKNAERITLWPWVQQASEAAKRKIDWCLWIKSNNRPWVVVLNSERYLELIAVERDQNARQLRRGQL